MLMEIEKAATDFEKEKKRIELALTLTGGDLEKAKKLVSGAIRDMAVLKGHFVEEEVNLFGSFIVFLCLETGALERMQAVITFDKNALTLTPFTHWPEFETSLIDFQWKKEYLTAQSQELKSTFESNYAFESMNDILEALRLKNEKKLTELLRRIVSKTLNLDTFRLEVGVEFINRFFLKYEGKEIVKSAEEQAASDSADQAKPENTYIKEGEVLLDAQCEISPVRGLNITQVQPGTLILIRLADRTDKDKYFINMFNARSKDGRKVLPLKAAVRYISYDETIGYLVISELGPGVVAKCLENAQIKVKTPQIEEKERKSRNLFRFIIVLGASLLLLAGLYVYLLLKGVF